MEYIFAYTQSLFSPDKGYTPNTKPMTTSYLGEREAVHTEVAFAQVHTNAAVMSQVLRDILAQGPGRCILAGLVQQQDTLAHKAAGEGIVLEADKMVGLEAYQQGDSHHNLQPVEAFHMNNSGQEVEVDQMTVQPHLQILQVNAKQVTFQMITFHHVLHIITV